jgi:hypothetical protein
MQIRIEAADLPGRNCSTGGNFAGYENIHVGVQGRGRPTELLDTQPGDAQTATRRRQRGRFASPTRRETRSAQPCGRHSSSGPQAARVTSRVAYFDAELRMRSSILCTARSGPCRHLSRRLLLGVASRRGRSRRLP